MSQSTKRGADEMRAADWMVFLERPKLHNAHDEQTDVTSSLDVFLPLFLLQLLGVVSLFAILSVLPFDPGIDVIVHPQQKDTSSLMSTLLDGEYMLNVHTCGLFLFWSCSVSLFCVQVCLFTFVCVCA